MNSCERIGIWEKWPKVKGVVHRGLKHSSDYSFELDKIDQYAHRKKPDPDNINVTDSMAGTLGYWAVGHPLIEALQGKPWLTDLARWNRYFQIGVRQSFFWHSQYRILWPDHPSGGLKMYSMQHAAEMMGITALLGWKDEVIYQGYMTIVALNRGYRLALEYEEEHRRAQVFILRLFSNWVGDISHQWPAYAYDEPIYENLLTIWRTQNSETLVPCLLAACDRHTHQTGQDSSKNFYDFSRPALMRTPIEILFLFRLREWEGLANPVLDHPLMAAPFDKLPEQQPVPELDELMQAVLKRAREDWPNFDEVLSLESLKQAVTSSTAPSVEETKQPSRPIQPDSVVGKLKRLFGEE